MATLLFTFGFFLLMVAAMAVGVLAGRGPILGSCGGMSALLDSDCPVCGGDPDKCDGGEPGAARDAPDIAYDAASKPTR
jgi:uncharacterized protein